MAFKCGNCKQTHETADEARACYAKRNPGAEPPSAAYVTSHSAAYFPPAPGPAPQPVEITEGFYKVTGTDTIYKVQRAVHGSGHLYAKRLTVAADGTSASFEYAPGVMPVLRSDGHPLTKEEAAEFGKLYGVCCLCGRTLTNEGSIEAGIGPICAGKQGW